MRVLLWEDVEDLHQCTFEICKHLFLAICIVTPLLTGAKVKLKRLLYKQKINWQLIGDSLTDFIFLKEEKNPKFYLFQFLKGEYFPILLVLYDSEPFCFWTADQTNQDF